MSSLRSLTDDMDLYHRAFSIYHRIAERDKVLGRWVEKELREVVNGWTAGVTGQEPLRVLSIGPGEGAIETKILQVLHGCRKPHPRIHTTVLEPVADQTDRFKQRVADPAAQLPDTTFDWRIEKLEDYQAAAANAAKFHFISSVHSIYYVPDLEASLKDLYARLEPGGLMLIVLVAEDSGMGRVWKGFPGLQSMRDPYPTSAEIESACASQGIPLGRQLTINVRSNIGFCLPEPPNLSEEGSLLLDFFAHVGHFVRDAPPDLQRKVREFLGSDKCSERGAGGEVIFKGDWRAFIIEK
ncbi:histamine N-methyltransferase A-like [Patiria miniata]|uniref:Histamine N-methyltransferase n=1 Tax=Patiria miniata TaxID=46514 RepID=A0A913ZBR5_PATMI|nr:histamine N-methyltransferase A-like [Patiria miniata]XP_038048487.1 histamine N-methyltransferase A-like [Patiria miniata]XP_038048488.1 histamine N-methyltransferase A-like [Patiria miniata]